jgi:hypothetical protein
MKKGTLSYIIVAVLIVAGLFAFKQFGTKDGKIKSEAVELIVTPDESVVSKSDENRHISRSFNYIPEKPVNGKIKGVIELGASGFNSFVVNLDKNKNWEILSKEFGKSMAYEGMTTTEEVKSQLKTYISNMFDKGVVKNGIHFVISSGAQKEPKTKTISDELSKMGYVVNNVTADQEGKLGLRSVQPVSFQSNSFVVDIGSGNTKISWYEGSQLKSTECPGAKYYENNISDENVYQSVKVKCKLIPSDKRKVCFVIGGVPYKLASNSRVNDERYTVLSEPSSYEKSDKKIASGINIYKAIVDETGCDTFVFDWDANFTIGYLLTINY